MGYLTDRKHGVEYPDVQRAQRLCAHQGRLSEEQGGVR